MLRLRLFSTIILFASILNATLLRAATPPINLVQLAELTPSTRATNDWFGLSIAVSGNTVVVGDFYANIETFGAVYAYVKPSTPRANITQLAKPPPPHTPAGPALSFAPT